MRGWYCGPGIVYASDCVPHLMDGIHISPEEGCDDGNSVDVGDGCSNSGIVEDKWDCQDNILQKSV